MVLPSPRPCNTRKCFERGYEQWTQTVYKFLLSQPYHGMGLHYFKHNIATVQKIKDNYSLRVEINRNSKPKYFNTVHFIPLFPWWLRIKSWLYLWSAANIQRRCALRPRWYFRNSYSSINSCSKYLLNAYNVSSTIPGGRQQWRSHTCSQTGSDPVIMKDSLL